MPRTVTPEEPDDVDDSGQPEFASPTILDRLSYEDPPLEFDDPATEATRLETAERVRAAVAALPKPAERDLIEKLFGFHDTAMTLGEYARAHATARATLHLRFEKALARLRMMLKETEGA